MARTIDTKAYLDTLCQLLADGQRDLPVPVAGVSMCPFLHPGDTVYLNLPDGELQKGQIYLFTRPDGSYVLHRLIRVEGDTLWMLGDSQHTPEPVPRRAVAAQVTAVRRGEKNAGPGTGVWWFYAHPWRWLCPWRRGISGLWEKTKRK